jgi:hypothetical protein
MAKTIMPDPAGPAMCSEESFCAPLQHSITPDTAPMAGVLELVSFDGVKRVGAKATKRHALVLFNLCPFCGVKFSES